MSKVSNITFGMAFKEAVRSANTQGLFDPDSVQARFIELLTILEKVAPEYGVDLSQEQYSKSKGSPEKKTERELPEGASVFQADGETWIDFRDAKLKGNAIPNHPDFKSFDYKKSVWMYNPEGDPNEEAGRLVVAAEAALV